MRICIAKKKDGTWCTHKAKYGLHCGYHRPDGFHKCRVRRVMDDGLEKVIVTLTRFVDELSKKMDAALLALSAHDHEIMSIKDDVTGLVRHLAPLTKSVDAIAQTLASLPIVGRFVT